jgi:thiosulfate/3-mercaptopyruvate sulfurtransferase
MLDLTLFLGGLKWHPAASKPGTIARAAAFNNERWFRSGGPLLKSPERLQSLVQEHNLGQTEITVSFCNTGHWAVTNWFVLSEIAGEKTVKLYPDSVVEWSTTNQPMDNVPNHLQWAWLSTKQWFEKTF